MRFTLGGVVYFSPCNASLESVTTRFICKVPRSIVFCFELLIERQGVVVTWDEILNLGCPNSMTKRHCQHQFNKLKKNLVSFGLKNNFIRTVQNKGLVIYEDTDINFEKSPGIRLWDVLN